MLAKNNNYIIGIDGGGTKTIAALADLNCKILKEIQTESINPRNVGIRKVEESIIKIINDLIPKNRKSKIALILIGLPAVEEEFKLKIKDIKRKILSKKSISKKLTGEIKIISDQLLTFHLGTFEKEGIVLVSGTGSVAHGWKNNEEFKVSGWGWLADEGSAFWIGHRVFQSVLKHLDGRGEKTLLTYLLLKKFNIYSNRNHISLINLLLKRVYSPDFIKNISSFSLICGLAAKKGDRVAKDILIESGKELALSVKTIIKRMNFYKTKITLVLGGSVFRSMIVLNTLKKEIKKDNFKTNFIILKRKSIKKVIKLAFEILKKRRFFKLKHNRTLNTLI